MNRLFGYLENEARLSSGHIFRPIRTIPQATDPSTISGLARNRTCNYISRNKSR